MIAGGYPGMGLKPKIISMKDSSVGFVLDESI